MIAYAPLMDATARLGFGGSTRACVYSISGECRPTVLPSYRRKRKKVCKVDGCDRTNIKGHGLCVMHYMRRKRHGGTELRCNNRDSGFSIPGIGSWDSMRACASYFGQSDGSNWSSRSKQAGVSSEQYVIEMLRGRVQAAEQKLLKWKAGIDSQREKRGRARLELIRNATDPEVVVWGLYTPLRFCKHCGVVSGGIRATKDPQSLAREATAACGPCEQAKTEKGKPLEAPEETQERRAPG